MGALLDPLVRQGAAAPRLDAGGGAPHRVYRRLQVRRRCLPFRLLLPLLACGHHALAEVLKKVYRDIPVFIMEGDIVDISSYNEADTRNRIDAFIETLATATGRSDKAAGLISRHAPVSRGRASSTYERVRLRAATPRFRHLASKFPPAGEKALLTHLQVLTFARGTRLVQDYL